MRKPGRFKRWMRGKLRRFVGSLVAEQIADMQAQVDRHEGSIRHMRERIERCERLAASALESSMLAMKRANHAAEIAASVHENVARASRKGTYGAGGTY